MENDPGGYFLYFVDAVSLRMVVKKALKSDADFIIFDRYAYDELANLNLRTPFARVYVRMIMMFVPRPHISYVLDADPVQARARNLNIRSNFYISVAHPIRPSADLLGGLTIIPPMPVQDVQRQVLQHAMEQLPSLTALEVSSQKV